MLATAPPLPQERPEVVMPACLIQKRLTGQKALVTGANSGIGKGIAIALAHAVADVVVNYHSDDDWLASDQADCIHGASIFVDGGMTLYPGFEAGG